jgi:hypothetical protein
MLEVTSIHYRREKVEEGKSFLFNVVGVRE